MLSRRDTVLKVHNIALFKTTYLLDVLYRALLSTNKHYLKSLIAQLVAVPRLSCCSGLFPLIRHISQTGVSWHWLLHLVSNLGYRLL